MSPAKKPVKWAGKNRRRPPPPPPAYWRGTIIGAALVVAGIAVHVALHERHFDLVPLALIIVGGAMIDPTAIRAASRMLSIRRNGGTTAESSTQGDM
jgi:hypothetical protein